MTWVARAGAFVAFAMCVAVAVADARPNPEPAKPAATEHETIALLPLDAGPRLEAFGQPVASEIGRALTAGKLDVVVVGPRASVPTTAKLIVDGALVAKGAAVVLQLRVRDPVDGTVLDTLEEVAPNLVAIDKASNRLSSKLLPVVRARLATLPQRHRAPDLTSHGRVVPVTNLTVAPAAMLFGVGVPSGASPTFAALRTALSGAVSTWIQARHRTPSLVDASTLGEKLAGETVATAKAERGIAFEILAYDIDEAVIPLARARIRIRVADRSGVVFERVLATDTVVGARGMHGDELAARVAREVLEIMRPLEKRWSAGGSQER
jgi:hypothetical protein